MDVSETIPKAIWQKELKINKRKKTREGTSPVNLCPFNLFASKNEFLWQEWKWLWMTPELISRYSEFPIMNIWDGA